MSVLNFNAATVKPHAGNMSEPEAASTPVLAEPPQAVSGGRVWSPYQTDIFNFIANGTGNAIVEAVAGSGKSTTIVEGVRSVPAGKTSLMLAFNKAIAEELKNRGVNARTFHSLCFSPVLKSRKVNNVETNKLRMLLKQNLSSNDAFVYGSFITKLVGLARNAGIGAVEKDTEEAWYALVEHHDLEIENERANMPDAIEHARDLLQWSNASNYVDFDDMLYLAVKDGIVLPKYDFVFVDEAQDTNAIQRAVLRKILHEESRVIFVGDPAQAIYGFRGADSNSMGLLQEEFSCVNLPLTISYRCAQSIVTAAHRYVQHIEAAPNAPEGEVVSVGAMNDVIRATGCNSTEEDYAAIARGHVFYPDDLVVCRSTKPLVELAFKLMRVRIPVKIMGREIGQGLKSTIDKMNASNVDDLVVKLEAWAAREIDKAIAKQLDAKVDQLQDKLDAILCLIDALAEDRRTIEDLKAGIDMLFNNNAQALTLATIHKSKGMEANRVWWLNSSKCPSRWARQEWQKQQELNLCYVAVTRAKTALLYIEDGSK
ncbi:UvrD Superfamily I DNA and RNA helicases [uncultured Caudovirales phage]|uniref:DNA 3'-5' helicase n=1 Tax=uncultured Caudovirales phage TaxID=2100421 RepID=A0A6J5RJC5_9CAUD|nr:UvrD Superfamily I DNA and RNA helicases [uncultured Caudovirales phage]